MNKLKMILCVMIVGLLASCSNSESKSIKENSKDIATTIGHSARDITKTIGHDTRNIVDGN